MIHKIYDNSDIWYGDTDIHIKMPPIKTYKIWVKIVKIKMGEPLKYGEEDVSVL